MKIYQDLLKEILECGIEKEDRTGVGTVSIFGKQLEFDLRKNFPIITTKKIFWRGIVHEVIWLLSGSTNIKYLKDNNVNIWNEWADENGDLGPVYGKQWRDWDGIDQINKAIATLKNNPDCRRNVVSGWNVSDLKKMSLPPCHCFFQLYSHLENNERYLSCQVYLRSNDMFLGFPFDLSGYALITLMFAQVCNMKPNKLVYTIGDAHIYKNHIEQVKLQLTREPYDLPKVEINPQKKEIDSFVFSDFKLVGYQSHKHIKGEVAV